jgi:hypothetical protein
MDAGVKLYQDKSYKAAVSEFELAYKERPKANPLLNIALCQRELSNFPKAIAALERALANHPDTMDETDKQAAAAAVTEMRAKLAHVTVDISPPHATLVVDGEDQPKGPPSRSVPLGPGTHTLAATAEGYAKAEQTLTVSSGETGKTIRLALVPDKAFLTIKAQDDKTAIAIDGEFKAHGRWSGLLPPGPHLVQMYRPGIPTENIQVTLTAGKTQEIHRAPAAARPPADGPDLPPKPPVPPAPVKKPAPEPPVRGAFAMVTGSLLAPVSHPRAFQDPTLYTGGAGGLRVGYRVNVAASFDGMFEYENVETPSGSDPQSSYTLESFRIGPTLRLMTPGKKVRFVGTIGFGATYDRISFKLSPEVRKVIAGTAGTDPGLAAWTSCRDRCENGSGLDPYVLGELGIEFNVGRVLIGGALQGYFQSTRGIETDSAVDVYEDPDPLFQLGGGLRVGYALW